MGQMSKSKFRGNTGDLFYELIRTDFILRYHNSLLGFIWVLLKPFLIFVILVTVFSLVFKIQDRLYPLNLLLGILIYSYFAEATLRGITSLTEKSTIIIKVNFPKVIVIFTSVVNSFISFFFGFLVFLVFWFLAKPDGSLLNLPHSIVSDFVLMAIVISQSQQILITGGRFDWWLFSYAFILTVFLFIAGWLFFKNRIIKITDNF